MSAVLDVFVDIDGVVRIWPEAGIHQPTTPRIGALYLADCVDLFFRSICEDPRIAPAWLSVWSQTGKRTWIRDRLWPFLPTSARKMKVPKWQEAKTEAIDPNRPWLWFDDEAFHTAREHEGKFLEANGTTVVAFEPDPGNIDWFGYRREVLVDGNGSGRLVILPGTKDNLRLALLELHFTMITFRT